MQTEKVEITTMSIELKDMSVSELKSLRRKVDKEIERKQKLDLKAAARAKKEAIKLKEKTLKAAAKARKKEEEQKRNEARKELAKRAKELGVDINSLFDNVKVSSLAIKYANPEDDSQTWTGRGRKPKWISAALENGKTLEEFEV